MISELLRLIELDNLRGVPELQIEEETGPTTEAPPEGGGKGEQAGRVTRLGISPSSTLTVGRGQGIRGITQTGLQESLTSFRPAGEIRAGTGKPRRNVWNEASLRLKDALGL